MPFAYTSATEDIKANEFWFIACEITTITSALFVVYLRYKAVKLWFIECEIKIKLCLLHCCLLNSKAVKIYCMHDKSQHMPLCTDCCTEDSKKVELAFYIAVYWRQWSCWTSDLFHVKSKLCPSALLSTEDSKTVELWFIAWGIKTMLSPLSTEDRKTVEFWFVVWEMELCLSHTLLSTEDSKTILYFDLLHVKSKLCFMYCCLLKIARQLKCYLLLVKSKYAFCTAVNNGQLRY